MGTLYSFKIEESMNVKNISAPKDFGKGTGALLRVICLTQKQKLANKGNGTETGRRGQGKRQRVKTVRSWRGGNALTILLFKASRMRINQTSSSVIWWGVLLSVKL